jgi:hypothetical protein
MGEVGVDAGPGVEQRPVSWEVQPPERADLGKSHIILGEYSCKVNPNATLKTDFVVGVDRRTGSLQVLYEGVGVSRPLDEAFAPGPSRGKITEILKAKLTQEGSKRVLELLERGETNITVNEGEIFKPEIWPIPGEEGHYVKTKPDGTGVDTLGMRWTAEQIAKLRKALAEKK